MRIDPHKEARRLLQQVAGDDALELARDPFGSIEILFDVEVITRPPWTSDQGCGVDGTYQQGPPVRITVANDVSPARQRFTALHELGHHLIYWDGPLNELTTMSSVDRRDEAICNEVAASLLIPDDLVDGTLPAGKFTAENLARLHAEAAHASRAACCVAATRRLHHPGCVILGRPDGTAEFISHEISTPWRIARGTRQGTDSLLVRAAAAQTRHARGETHVRFASGADSSLVHGDAYCAPDGWVYMVVMVDSHSPWATSLNFESPNAPFSSESVECPRCDNYFTPHWARCQECGDYKCPECRHCSCGSDPAALRMCTVCTYMKPVNQFDGPGVVCVDCR